MYVQHNPIQTRRLFLTMVDADNLRAFVGDRGEGDGILPTGSDGGTACMAVGGVCALARSAAVDNMR